MSVGTLERPPVAPAPEKGPEENDDEMSREELYEITGFDRAAHDAKIDSIAAGEAEQPVEEEPSYGRSRVTRATERVAQFLTSAAERVDNYGANREARQTARSEQADAFDSYESNIQATSDREQAEKDAAKQERREARQEALEDAKKAISTLGRAALRGVKKAGKVTVEAGASAAEAVKDKALDTVDSRRLRVARKRWDRAEEKRKKIQQKQARIDTRRTKRDADRHKKFAKHGQKQASESLKMAEAMKRIDAR